MVDPTMTKRKETNTIIFHHSLSADVPGSVVRVWHTERGFEDIGYAYLIHDDGRIETGRDPTMIGAHAKGRNIDSIGVCVMGDFRYYEPTHFQLQSARALYWSECRKYKKRLAIEFHRPVDDKNPCPGVKLDRESFVKLLSETVKEDDVGLYRPEATVKKSLVEAATVTAGSALLIQLILENLFGIEIPKEEIAQASGAIGVLSGLVRGLLNWKKNRKK